MPLFIGLLMAFGAFPLWAGPPAPAPLCSSLPSGSRDDLKTKEGCLHLVQLEISAVRLEKKLIDRIQGPHRYSPTVAFEVISSHKQLYTLICEHAPKPRMCSVNALVMGQEDYDAIDRKGGPRPSRIGELDAFAAALGLSKDLDASEDINPAKARPVAWIRPGAAVSEPRTAKPAHRSYPANVESKPETPHVHGACVPPDPC